MSYIDKTFTFDAGLESWTGYPTGVVSLTRNTSDGSPGTGCLSARLTGKNQNPGNSYWEWVGTWEDLGVPANSTVTEIGTDPNNDYNWRCSEYVTGSDGNSFAGPLEIYDNTPTLQGTIVSAQGGVSSTTSWAAANGTAVSVPSAIQASTNTIRLRINVTLRTGNSGTAVVAILQDQIALRITYTAASNPVNVEVPVATLAYAQYAPTVSKTEDVLITVPAGSLSLTAYVPTVTAPNDVSVEVPNASLSLTTYIPDANVSNDISVTVPVASLSLLTYAPSINVSTNVGVTVPNATLSLAAYIPTLNVQVFITVPPQQLVLTTYPPECPSFLVVFIAYTGIDSGDVNITVPTASLSLVPWTPSLPSPGDYVTVYETSSSSQTNRPISIARVFAQGEIAEYAKASVNGTPVTTQCDVKNRWPDGSLKFAIVSFVIPSLSADGSVTVSFSNQSTGNNSGYLTKSDMLDGSYDFESTIALTNSTTETVSARTMLNADSFRYWLQGPIVTAVIIEDRTTDRAYDVGNGLDSGTDCLHPIFEAWFYPQDHHVEIGACIENIWASYTVANSMRDVIYSVEIKKGYASPTTVYTQSQFVHIGLTRWQKRFIINEPQTVRVDHNFEYMVTTKAIPRFDTSVSIVEALIASTYSNYINRNRDLMGADAELGSYSFILGSGGAKPWIGLFPLWDILLLYTFDDRLYEVTFGNADLAGCIPWNFREADSGAGTGGYYDADGTIDTFGRPISLNARPLVALYWPGYYTSGPDAINTGTITYGAWTEYNLGPSHFPDIGYLPYLLSGRYYYLEQMQFEAAYAHGYKPGTLSAELSHVGANGFFNQLKRDNNFAELRGNAWCYRTSSYAAFLSPDDSPEKDYFVDKLLNNIAKDEGQHELPLSVPNKGTQWQWGQTKLWTANYPYVSPLGIIFDGVGPVTAPCPPIIDDGSVTKSFAPWQQHFFVSGLGVARDFGFPADRLLEYLGKYYHNAILNSAMTPYLIASKRGGTEDANSNWLTDWADYKAKHSYPLPLSWLDADENCEMDQGHSTYALIVCAYLKPYLVEGYKGVDAWTWIKANMWQQEHFGDISPKCAVLPTDYEYTHQILEGIDENEALDLGVYPSYLPSGGINENTITDFSGFTYNPVDKCMLMFGGGHSATYANYVMRLNLFPGSSLVWERDHERTNRNVMLSTNLSSMGTWIDGGLSRDGQSDAPDGLPITNHTYTMFKYAQNHGVAVVLRPGAKNASMGDNLPIGDDVLDFNTIITDKRIWHYNPKTKLWTASDQACPSLFDSAGADLQSCYDPISGRILVPSPGNTSSINGLFTYEPDTMAWTHILSQTVTAIATSGATVYFPPTDRFYHFARMPGSPAQLFTTRVFEIVLNRSNWANSTITEVTGMVDTPMHGITNWAYDSRNKIIGGGILNGHFYAYNPVTKVWTDRTMSPVGTWYSGEIGTQIHFALDFDEVNGVFIFITNATSGRHVGAYRYAP